MKMKNLAALSLAILGLFLSGCTTSNSHEVDFGRMLRELRIADVSQWPNSILVGEMFPGGRTLPVSDDQARRLQRVLLDARPAGGDPADSGILISPAPRLCALSSGQTH